MRSLIQSLVIASVCLFAVILNGSENAVIIVNAESASSKLIANHYIALRNIPAENVIYLSGIPQKEIIPIVQFRNKILNPIATTIAQRKLANQIDYIIYSSDFPTIINAKSDRDLLLKSERGVSGLAANSKLLSPFISINSATFFLDSILRHDASYLSMTANTYSRSNLTTTLLNPFAGGDREEFEAALAAIRAENFDKAIVKLTALAEKHPLQLAVLYWLARTYAWSEDRENTIQWLKRCMAIGWCYREYTSRDSAFAKLKENEEFQALVALMPNLPPRYGPTMSFRSSYLWGQNGMVNSTPEEGNPYILSTILAINRNQGNSETETLRYLKSSAKADGSRPQGTFYFTKTGDVRTKTRFQGIDEAVEELNQLGFNTQIINAKIPSGKQDIAGLSIGTAKFVWPRNNAIIPGAICENLTSFGGRLLPESKQTKLSEFLRYGAAGSSGTIIEPYAVQPKFPHPRIHVHYVKGCTLAESFYQSVSGPFQLLIVGDALCQPWANIPQVTLNGDLKSGSPLNGNIEFSLESTQSGKPVRLIEMYIDGRLIRRINSWQTGRIELDTTTMPDGYHEFRFVGVAAGTIQTRGSLVVPVEVKNRDASISLKTRDTSHEISKPIAFEVTAEGASEIRLVHNSRTLEVSDSDRAIFRIPAHKLGRGPVSVSAIAVIEKEVVRSQPVHIRIAGPIQTSTPVIKSPRKKKPKQNKESAG